MSYWKNLNVDEIYANGISQKNAVDLINANQKEYFEQIMPLAKELRERAFGNKVSFCSITNAKSGACIEDCKFCAQSAHYKEAESPVYGLKSAEKIAEDAKQAEKFGATEFSIVTSGRGMTKERELDVLVDALDKIHQETELESCASLGLMKREDLLRLKNAGMIHYHHNIETARSYFKEIVTTHTFDEEMQTMKTAKELGFDICCGGILGMGESKDQRVEFAFNLKEVDPDSIPLNFLNPRPGTPLIERHNLTPFDSLKAISLIRLVLPQKELFVCGGREVNLAEYQDQMFDAGASGTMLGNYLTTKGQNPESDIDMIERLGLQSVAPHRKADSAAVATQERNQKAFAI